MRDGSGLWYNTRIGNQTTMNMLQLQSQLPQASGSPLSESPASLLSLSYPESSFEASGAGI